MAEATVKWNVRAAGRDVGDIETFELDGVFARGVLASGYITVLDEVTENVDSKPDVSTLSPEEAADELVNDLGQPYISDHPQSAESLGLVKPKPSAKPVRRGE